MKPEPGFAYYMGRTWRPVLLAMTRRQLEQMGLTRNTRVYTPMAEAKPDEAPERLVLPQWNQQLRLSQPNPHTRRI